MKFALVLTFGLTLCSGPVAECPTDYFDALWIPAECPLPVVPEGQCPWRGPESDGYYYRPTNPPNCDVIG